MGGKAGGYLDYRRLLPVHSETNAETEFRSDSLRIRLPSVGRRLAAIPLSGTEFQSDIPAVPEPQVAEAPSVPFLGAVSAALVCIGCMLKRRVCQAKERMRDLLPSSRSSLNEVEINV